MKRKTAALLGIVLLAGGIAGCDLLDPSNTKNPDVTERDFLNFPNAMESWLTGMERQTAVTMSRLIIPAEIASDNYVNTHTFYNQFMDRLVLDYTDRDIEQALISVSELREMAEFGLDVVATHDASTTPEQLADLWFFKGIAHLYTGEWWHLAPADSAGPAVPSAGQFRLAVEALNHAVELSDDAGYHIALARAYRNLGDGEHALAEAEKSLAMDADFVRFAQYDHVNGPENGVQNALYHRGSYDDLQPLARLDYLDPKFFLQAAPGGGDDESADLAYVKAEEAFAIAAEVKLAKGDLAGAVQHMNGLLALVKSRKVVQLVDQREDRSQLKPGTRPNSADWRVAFGPDESLRTGLVVSRKESAAISVISGTCVNAEDLARLTSVDQALETLYLMRQEIFIAEGRRMYDLGIQWPVPQVEVLNNANIEVGAATTGVVPSFLPPGSEFDAFDSIDFDAKTAVLKHDLNKILVRNKASEAVLPLF